MIYKELILEEYKHPRNKEVLETYTHTCHVKNPSCGDEITIYLNVVNGTLQAVGFDGHGCAISQASASLFTEEIKGKPVADIERMDETIVTELLGFTPNPMRMKCAVLVQRAVSGALEEQNAND